MDRPRHDAQVKLRAATDGRTIRSRIEEAFNDWLVKNPVNHTARKIAIR